MAMAEDEVCCEMESGIFVLSYQDLIVNDELLFLSRLETDTRLASISSSVSAMSGL